MRRALVFGGSGQIGRPVIERLRGDGWQIDAVSRQAHDDSAGLRWLRGDLAQVEGLPAAVDAIFSCGPLDHFARWYARAEVVTPRVIAFGSTSIEVKHDSVDAGERDLARRLGEGEAGVFATAAARGAQATLLRPTLVYGAGEDRSLSRIAALAGRWGWCPLPSNACGLRQPVHVDDLADAALGCIDQPASAGQAYALPGGETLPYRDMVARVLAKLQPPARLIGLPTPLFKLALRLAQVSGRARGLGATAVARMHEDLVFDAGPAQRDFGYAPRPFNPTMKMFAQVPSHRG